MKIDLCYFSGYKIYPGHGRTLVSISMFFLPCLFIPDFHLVIAFLLLLLLPLPLVFVAALHQPVLQIKGDGKSYKFASSRAHKAHLLKRNPRNISWTVLYRRKHKKGLEEDVTKKRTRRAQKFQRAVVGATLQDIMAKRNQKPEVSWGRAWGSRCNLMMTKPHVNFNHVRNIHSYSDFRG